MSGPPLAAMLALGAVLTPREANPLPTFTFGGHVIGDVTHVGYSGALLVPNDHGATPEQRAVTRGPTRNPGRLTRRERRRRAGR